MKEVIKLKFSITFLPPIDVSPPRCFAPLLFPPHSYLKLGYLGQSPEIPKEHTPGFVPGGRQRVKIKDSFVMLYAYALKFFKCLHLDSHLSQSIHI